MLWQLVQLHAPETHELELDETGIDPLWQIAFARGSADGKIRVLAGTMPEITEQQKKRVVRLLRGTSKTMVDALAELGLEHPAAYVEKKVADRIAWKQVPVADESGHPGSVVHRWESVTPATVGEKVMNAVHWPK